jgi:sulfate adenylyltransferase
LFNVRKKKYNPLILYQIFGNKYASEANVKKKYSHLVKKISSFNMKSYENIKKIRNKKVIAFQTRNIPHLGHEKIIKHYLSKNYAVVVNPLLGPKKKGDIKSKYLIKFYLYLKKKI